MRGDRADQRIGLLAYSATALRCPASRDPFRCPAASVRAGRHRPMPMPQRSRQPSNCKIQRAELLTLRPDYPPQHFLNFIPEPHRHSSFRPCFFGKLADFSAETKTGVPWLNDFRKSICTPPGTQSSVSLTLTPCFSKKISSNISEPELTKTNVSGGTSGRFPSKMNLPARFSSSSLIKRPCASRRWRRYLRKSSPPSPLR